MVVESTSRVTITPSRQMTVDLNQSAGTSHLQTNRVEIPVRASQERIVPPTDTLAADVKQILAELKLDDSQWTELSVSPQQTKGAEYSHSKTVHGKKWKMTQDISATKREYVYDVYGKKPNVSITELPERHPSEDSFTETRTTTRQHSVPSYREVVAVPERTAPSRTTYTTTVPERATPSRSTYTTTINDSTHRDYRSTNVSNDYVSPQSFRPVESKRSRDPFHGGYRAEMSSGDLDVSVETTGSAKGKSPRKTTVANKSQQTPTTKEKKKSSKSSKKDTTKDISDEELRKIIKKMISNELEEDKKPVEEAMPAKKAPTQQQPRRPIDDPISAKKTPKQQSAPAPEPAPVVHEPHSQDMKKLIESLEFDSPERRLLEHSLHEDFPISQSMEKTAVPQEESIGRKEQPKQQSAPQPQPVPAAQPATQPAQPASQPRQPVRDQLSLPVPVLQQPQSKPQQQRRPSRKEEFITLHPIGTGVQTIDPGLPRQRTPSPHYHARRASFSGGVGLSPRDERSLQTYGTVGRHTQQAFNQPTAQGSYSWRQSYSHLKPETSPAEWLNVESHGSQLAQTMPYNDQRRANEQQSYNTHGRSFHREMSVPVVHSQNAGYNQERTNHMMMNQRSVTQHQTQGQGQPVYIQGQQGVGNMQQTQHLSNQVSNQYQQGLVQGQGQYSQGHEGYVQEQQGYNQQRKFHTLQPQQGLVQERRVFSYHTQNNNAANRPQSLLLHSGGNISSAQNNATMSAHQYGQGTSGRLTAQPQARRGYRRSFSYSGQGGFNTIGHSPTNRNYTQSSRAQTVRTQGHQGCMQGANQGMITPIQQGGHQMGRYEMGEVQDAENYGRGMQGCSTGGFREVRIMDRSGQGSAFSPIGSQSAYADDRMTRSAYADLAVEDYDMIGSSISATTYHTKEIKQDKKNKKKKKSHSAQTGLTKRQQSSSGVSASTSAINRQADSSSSQVSNKQSSQTQKGALKSANAQTAVDTQTSSWSTSQTLPSAYTGSQAQQTIAVHSDPSNRQSEGGYTYQQGYRTHEGGAYRHGHGDASVNYGTQTMAAQSGAQQAAMNGGYHEEHSYSHQTMPRNYTHTQDVSYTGPGSYEYRVVYESNAPQPTQAAS